MQALTDRSLYEAGVRAKVIKELRFRWAEEERRRKAEREAVRVVVSLKMSVCACMCAYVEVWEERGLFAHDSAIYFYLNFYFLFLFLVLFVLLLLRCY